MALVAVETGLFGAFFAGLFAAARSVTQARPVTKKNASHSDETSRPDSQGVY